LIDTLEQIGPPMTEEDRAALAELGERIRRFLDASADTMPAAREGGSAKQTAMELSCLLCGEEAGTLVDGRELHPRQQNSVRRVGNQLVCGRCGGKLTASSREQYFYTF
jgi:hypothetical protein